MPITRFITAHWVRTLSSALILALAARIGAVQAATIYVRPESTGNPTGESWATAFPSIQQGLSVAKSGDELWVASGTYTENVTLTSGVALYGGFAGSEATRLDRDPANNHTIMDGGQKGAVVQAGADVIQQAVVDGFTVRGGAGTGIVGGAVMVMGGSLALSQVQIAGNGTAGVYVENGTLALAGCAVTLNARAGLSLESTVLTAARTIVSDNGGGIEADNSALTVRDSVLSGNRGGGLSLSDSTVTLTGLTIVANSGVGVSCSGVNLTLANSLIAFNSTGVVLGSSVATLHSNDVYGNASFDWIGIADPTGQNGNIRKDPLLADLYRNPHLQAYSPCVDAGDDTAVVAGELDIDGQSRVQGLHTDIGADESDGTLYPVPVTRVIRVSPSGSDANDGSAWTSAKRSVSSALASAEGGDEVWVAAGVYTGPVVVGTGVGLFGGFSGEESRRTDRSWQANLTVLDGGGTGPVVTVAYYGSTLDGFTIRNGANTGTGGSASTYGGGVLCTGDRALIQHNVITGNSADFGGGIAIAASGARIANNLIIQNTAKQGGAVYAFGGAIELFNNTIAGNSVTVAGAVGSLGTTLRLSNNIVAFNASGIFQDVAIPGFLSFTANDVWGNDGPAYSGFTDPTGTLGNIQQDPLFVDREGGDYRLAADSPCIDSGDGAVVPTGDEDLAGRPRIIGVGVDMGALEFGAATPYTLADVQTALAIAGGLQVPSAVDTARLDTIRDLPSSLQVDVNDAVLLLRKVAGIERNP